MEHRGEGLFHPHRGAAAVDIARQGQQFFLGQHGDGLLPHRFCRFLQIKALSHGDVKDVILSRCTLRHQRLEHLFGVNAQVGRHRNAVHRAALGGVGIGGVGDLLLLQRAHHVGLFLFHLCHGLRLLILLPAAPRRPAHRRCPAPSTHSAPRGKIPRPSVPPPQAPHWR